MLITYTIITPAVRKETNKATGTEAAAELMLTRGGSTEEPVCRLTAQVVHLLLLQQAGGVLVPLQYQLRLRVLAGRRQAAKRLFRLDHRVLLRACGRRERVCESSLTFHAQNGSIRYVYTRGSTEP